MMRGVRWRFYVEAGAGVMTTALFLATLLHPDWIETLFRIDPDNGAGSLERFVVGSLLVMTIVLLSLARREWRERIAAA
jgi:ABC-type transport system involved in cytochrome c biogenesis permease component